MACWLFPYQSFVGNAQIGRIVPARGLPHNVRFESNADEPFHPILSWSHLLATGQTVDQAHVRLYRDGDWEQTVVGYTKATVAAIRPSDMIQYDIEPATALEASFVDSSNGFYAKPIGDRAELTWTENTADDFDAYLLYWDAGDGGTVDTLFKTIKGSGNTRAISSQLTNGTTYQFALAFQDLVGNTTSIGTISSITADTIPLALEQPTISYNNTTRIATVSGNHPAGQHSDVAGVALFDNYLPGIGLSEYPNADYQFRRQFNYGTAPNAGITFYTQELHAGQWAFAMGVFDRYGNMSTYQTMRLNLALSGGTLDSASIQPLAPINLTATPAANATMTLSWEHDGTNVSVYNLYGGGTLLATDTTNLTTSPHSKTLPGLVDGTQYTFWAKAANGGIESPSSNSTTATADATAPIGSQALTVELTR